MASPNWIGGATAVAQAGTVTVGSTVSSGYTYTITIGSASVTYTAGGADTQTTVGAALFALVTAATAAPQFAEATWTNPSAGVVAYTQLAKYAGEEAIVVSASHTGASATLTAAVTTAATGPGDWGNAANWSTGAVPVTGDSVTITGNVADITMGLAQSAVTLASLAVNSKFVEIGLSPINANGYPEYRPLYLAIGATVLNVIQASGRVKINTGSVAAAVTMMASASSVDSSAGVPAVLLLANSTSTTVQMLGGTLGVAFYGGETAALGSLDQSGGSITAGTGAQITAIDNAGGNFSFSPNNVTTTLRLDADAGTVIVVSGSATGIGTISVYGGTLDFRDGGTITALKIGAKGQALFTNNLQARTVTNTTLTDGATLTDSSATVTFTNPILLDGCRLDDVSIDAGFARHVQFS